MVARASEQSLAQRNDRRPERGTEPGLQTHSGFFQMTPIPLPSNSLARCRERVRVRDIVWRNCLARHMSDAPENQERSLTRRSKTNVDLSRHRERQLRREVTRRKSVSREISSALISSNRRVAPHLSFFFL